jgi:hypothetical protein
VVWTVPRGPSPLALDCSAVMPAVANPVVGRFWQGNGLGETCLFKSDASAVPPVGYPFLALSQLRVRFGRSHPSGADTAFRRLFAFCSVHAHLGVASNVRCC